MFAPEIWAKIFSANQIAGFFYQLLKYPDFEHIDTYSCKIKIDQKF